MITEFRQFVLKVDSRCNLACDYCYMYEAADQSWRRRPVVMSDTVVEMIGRRIGDHAVEHQQERVGVTLHGGEPLLLRVTGLSNLVQTLQNGIKGRTQLDIVVQTNGVLLDEGFARYFSEQGIRVGISLDGGRRANDRHRLFRNGASSFEAVSTAIRLMASPAHSDVFAGVLCTIDPVNDPVEVFHDLTRCGTPRLDLLLPHATWEAPPPAAEPGRTVYGDWLVAFFDAWYDAPPEVEVRLFQNIMDVLLGGVSTSEAVGLSSPESIVVETDGSIERTDALKVAYEGAAATGYNVHDHSFDEVLRHPAIITEMRGLSGLPTECQSCPIVQMCGGGLLPHRYRETTGFDNRSVYCHDLAHLITHMRERITADLEKRSRRDDVHKRVAVLSK
jgi:uncharacterized protein